MSIVNPNQIASAVASRINEGAYSQAVTAAVMLRPLFDLKELDALKVTVVPVSFGYQREARGVYAGQYEVDVAVQKKIVIADMSADNFVLKGLDEGFRSAFNQFAMRHIEG